ncbi:MAG: hypothetical protein WBP93_10515 [Pyrinomonadaceae bacterium]
MEATLYVFSDGFSLSCPEYDTAISEAAPRRRFRLSVRKQKEEEVAFEHRPCTRCREAEGVYICPRPSLNQA